MKQEISSLMDGELDSTESGRAIQACCASEDLKREWYLYHAIGDAMRGQAPRKLAMPEDVFETLKTQPTVLAPRRGIHSKASRYAMAAAASVATLGVVGWIGSQGGAGVSLPSVATSRTAIQPVAKTVTVQPAAAPTDVQDYLAAHRQMPSPESYRTVNNRAAAAAR